MGANGKGRSRRVRSAPGKRRGGSWPSARASRSAPAYKATMPGKMHSRAPTRQAAGGSRRLRPTGPAGTSQTTSYARDFHMRKLTKAAGILFLAASAVHGDGVLRAAGVAPGKPGPSVPTVRPLEDVVDPFAAGTVKPTTQPSTRPSTQPAAAAAAAGATVDAAKPAKPVTAADV